MYTMSQFHQYFTHSFFVRKLVQIQTLSREKLLKRLSKEKCARKMLMKLTPCQYCNVKIVYVFKHREVFFWRRRRRLTISTLHFGWSSVISWLVISVEHCVSYLVRQTFRRPLTQLELWTIPVWGQFSNANFYNHFGPFK